MQRKTVGRKLVINETLKQQWEASPPILGKAWIDFTLAKSGRVSDRTMVEYRNRYEKFTEYLDGEKLISEINMDIVQFWVKTLRDSGLAINTVNGCVDWLKTFLYWIEDNPTYSEHLKINPRRIHRLKTPKDLPRHIELEDFKKLLKVVPQDSFCGLRFYTAAHLLLDTGIRVGECCGIKHEHVNTTYITVHRGKGDKSRVIPISDKMGKMLKKWIAISKAQLESAGIESEWLFPNNQGGCLNRSYLCQEFREYSQIAGVKIVAHQIRHSFAFLSLQKGIDIFRLKELLGHSHLSVTSTYLRFSDKDLLNGTKYSPLDDL